MSRLRRPIPGATAPAAVVIACGLGMAGLWTLSGAWSDLAVGCAGVIGGVALLVLARRPW